MKGKGRNRQGAHTKRHPQPAFRTSVTALATLIGKGFAVVVSRQSAFAMPASDQGSVAFALHLRRLLQPSPTDCTTLKFVPSWQEDAIDALLAALCASWNELGQVLITT